MEPSVLGLLVSALGTNWIVLPRWTESFELTNKISLRLQLFLWPNWPLEALKLGTLLLWVPSVNPCIFFLDVSYLRYKNLDLGFKHLSFNGHCWLLGRNQSRIYQWPFRYTKGQTVPEIAWPTLHYFSVKSLSSILGSNNLIVSHTFYGYQHPHLNL